MTKKLLKMSTLLVGIVPSCGKFQTATKIFFLPLLAVSKEHRALELLKLGGGCVHAVDAMFRGAAEDGDHRRSGDLEALHEAIRQDRGQGAHAIRRRAQEGLPQPREGRVHRLRPHEQHPADADPAREDVPVNGRTGMTASIQ